MGKRTDGNQPMWCLVMFDLPVKTNPQRKAATVFRNALLDQGFSMAQFSVYVQYLPMASRLSSVVKTVKSCLPEGGDVRIVTLTDNQWAKAIRFSNAGPAEQEETPSQLMIF